MFDLRLAGAWRGQGLAAQVLRAAADRVFTTWANVNRFEGQTREDNLAMRHVFVRAGWVQEGTTTPIMWELPESPRRSDTPTGE